jgi:hypothetical protein
MDGEIRTYPVHLPAAFSDYFLRLAMRLDACPKELLMKKAFTWRQKQKRSSDSLL